jgi:hypothetical protein
MRSSLLGFALLGSAVSLLALAATHPHRNPPGGHGPGDGTTPLDPNLGEETVSAATLGPDRSERAPSWVAKRSVDGPPVSLTASDGSGLKLAELRASAIVEGPLAYTEMRLTFDNPENRIREGTFKITLPEGASIGRFAMKIGGAWQEGEVVKKERARVAYEDALHHRQDPALFERGAGNEFTARVFPIPAFGRKELIVSYAQELTGGAPYGLPLRGLPELGMLDVSVSGEGVTPQHLHQERVAPSTDFIAADAKGPSPMALRAGNLVVARVRPVAEALPDPVKGAIVLVDTSASRALGLEGELRQVEAVLHGLGERGGTVPVTVAAFDQEVLPVYQGDASGFSEKEVATLLSRRALGASNVEAALGWAKDQAKKTGARRVILVTDGVATAGQDDAAKLAVTASSLKEGGAERLDVVAVGGIRDDAMARKLVTAGLAHDGVVVQGTEEVATVMRRLESGTRSDVAVAVEGASWSYPTRLDGVQPGDEVLVYAELPEGTPLRLKLGGAEAKKLDAIPADRPLVERAWAEAKIASLEADERNHGKSLETEQAIVALSTSHRVLSNYTSLLVLESDGDYARFGIDRKALADILTVDDAGKFAWLKRTGQEPPTELAKNEKTPVVSRQTYRDFAPAPAASAAPPSGPGSATSFDDEDGSDPSVRAARAKGGARGGEDNDDGVMDLAGALAPPPPDDTRAGGTGTRARGEEGSMGNPASLPRASRPATAAAPRYDQVPGDPLGGPAPAQGEDSLRHVGGGGQLVGSGGVGTLGHGAGTGSAVPAPTSAPAAPPMGLFAQAMAAPPDLAEAGGVAPFTGTFKQVKEHLARNDASGAYTIASSWQASNPGDVLALVSLGEASEARGDTTTAARAYGSIIDLFPSRADLRRFAGERLEHVKAKSAVDLAIDTFDKARRDRPDHPESHRLAAYARLRRAEYAAAFDILVAGLAQRYPEGRFRGVDRILREDLGLVAAAWMKADPAHKDEILTRLRNSGGSVEDGPSIRFVLNWETDANDVDFHIHDAMGGHAYYSQPHLASGGDLYADVTTGYGPECFTIRAAKGNRVGPYSLQAHYYSRGPMGYGMGKLEIIDHDGKGGLKFEERPFIVMQDHAFVNLGTVD